MLSAFYVGALSTLIIVVLHFRSNNSSITIISESDSDAFLSLQTFYTLECLVIFVKAGHKVLGKSNLGK